jgi:hypothetical protein
MDSIKVVSVLSRGLVRDEGRTPLDEWLVSPQDLTHPPNHPTFCHLDLFPFVIYTRVNIPSLRTHLLFISGQTSPSLTPPRYYQPPPPPTPMPFELKGQSALACYKVSFNFNIIGSFVGGQFEDEIWSHRLCTE